MAKHLVKCSICGQQFDANTEQYVNTSSRRYAHKNCFDLKQKEQEQLEKEKNDLENYIMKLFNISYVDARIHKQINEYINNYKYTYSGIQKALVYHYEVKNGDIEKANGGIGIVPYVYQNAFNYYYSLWEAKQKNENKVIKEYVPEVQEIIIPIPKRKIKPKRKLFTFLDEEQEDDV